MKNLETQNEIVNLNKMVDFTLLDARATLGDLEKLCDIAYKNEYFSVCVNPCNVSYVKGYILDRLLGKIKVATVIGFPLGANTTEVKICEAKQALNDGVDELDVVINIGRAKQGDFEYVKNELAKIKKVAGKHIVKAIIETCYFDENEIVSLCGCCVKAKVDYVKTSTGFGTGGANINIVKLIHNRVKGKCLIKASGGIRTRDMAIELVNAGANRIGTSHIV